MKNLIDFKFSTLEVSNSDGSFPVKFVGASVVDGPKGSVLSMGEYEKVLQMNRSSTGKCDIASLKPDAEQFCIQLLMKPTDVVSNISEILSCNKLPFSLVLEKENDMEYSVWGRVDSKFGPDTKFNQKLTFKDWVTVALAYDFEEGTLALFINERLYSIFGYEERVVLSDSGKDLTFRNFIGELAAFSWSSGIPEFLHDQMKGLHESAEWNITRKYMEFTRSLTTSTWELGEKAEALKSLSKIQTGACVQLYKGAKDYSQDIGGYGAIMFSDAGAFEMHKGIYRCYMELSEEDKTSLGLLISDVFDYNYYKNGEKLCSMALFSNPNSDYNPGGIYYCEKKSKAFLVPGMINENYNNKLSQGYLPVSNRKIVDDGGNKQRIYQRFKNWVTDDKLIEDAVFFFNKQEKNGYWVLGREDGWDMDVFNNLESTNYINKNGTILEAFLAAGGIKRCGLPTSEVYTVRPNGKMRKQEFEKGIIYQTNGKSFFLENGDVLAEYIDKKEDAGPLGAPVSNITTIEKSVGYIYIFSVCIFENGILWQRKRKKNSTKNPENPVLLHIPISFYLTIFSINSKNSEGVFGGQNDLYIDPLVLFINGNVVLNKVLPKDEPNYKWDDGRQRVSEKNTDWPNDDIITINYKVPYEIILDNLSTKINFSLNVMECDAGNRTQKEPDYIGTLEKDLDIYNAWGFLDFGIHSDKGTKGKRLKEVKWKVSNPLSDAEVKNLPDLEKWWGFHNKKGNVSFNEFARAFNCDPDTEWYDPRDWDDDIWYKCIGGKQDGLCFGMCLEQIYSIKRRSLFDQPIHRFNDIEGLNGLIRSEIEVKHIYQYGKAGVFYVIDKVLSGKSRAPKYTYYESKKEFEKGNDPMLAVMTGEFKHGHILLPIKWEQKGNNYEITVYDPNSPNNLQVLTVNVQNNSFEYKFGSYFGKEWSGDRLFHYTFPMFSKSPKNPWWSLVGIGLGIAALAIIVIFGDCEHVSITDGTGSDLDALGEEAEKYAKAGKDTPSRFFVKADFYNDSPRMFVRRTMKSEAATNVSFDFIHTVKGNKKGKMEYMTTQSFNTIKIETDIEKGEENKVEIINPGAGRSNVKFHTPRKKPVSFEILKYIGMAGDFIKYRIDNLQIDPSEDLEIKIKKGLSGLEILKNSKNTNIKETVVNVNISSSFNKKTTEHKCKLALGKGIRLRPKFVEMRESLIVQSIDKFNGKALKTVNL